MNREILFRGKSLNTGLWSYGDLRQDNVRKKTYIEYEVDPKTVGQYTGLTDKNGKKIFEEDILFQEQELLGVVCISKRYGVSILKKTTTWSLINFVLDSNFDAGVLSDVEVVGNIYDNPELMKGGKE